MNLSSGYEGKTAIVTGGAGFIGSNLVRALLKIKASRIVIVDDLSSSFVWSVPSNPRVSLVCGSITDDEVLAEAFKEEVDIVFHLATLFANQNSIEHPEKDLLVNGLGTLKVLRHLCGTNVGRFVYTSSSGVYGSEGGLPMDEESTKLILDTPYQITKLLGEQYCGFFYRHYGLPIVNLRLFNVYGPGEVPGRYRGVIANFIYWALSGKALPITGTGEETRDFTFVDDVVEGILLAGIVDEAISKTINIATGVETKIMDVARMINELTGNDGGITFLPKRQWDRGIQKRASIGRAKHMLGFRSKTHLSFGIRRTIEWFEENIENIEKSAIF